MKCAQRFGRGTGVPRRVVLAIVALLALAGCTGSDPGDGPDVGPSATADGLTPSGSTLELGDTATVTRTDGTAVFELTVTEIEKGTAADLRSVGYDRADQDTPYFVRYELRLVSGDVQGVTMRHYLSAWAGDRPAAALVLSERFPRCQERNFPAGASAGASIASCRPYLTDNGAAPVDSVHFANDTDGSAAKPVVWR